MKINLNNISSAPVYKKNTGASKEKTNKEKRKKYLFFIPIFDINLNCYVANIDNKIYKLQLSNDFRIKYYFSNEKNTNYNEETIKESFKNKDINSISEYWNYFSKIITIRGYVVDSETLSVDEEYMNTIYKKALLKQNKIAYADFKLSI